LNEAMLFWGLGLLAVALLLVVVEVFVPSGGLIAVVSVGAAAVGIYCLFRADPSRVWGFIGIAIVVVLGPAVMAFAFKVWPSTPLGRRMLGEPPPEQVEAARLEEQKQRDRMAALVGAEGRVITALRPVGLIEIDGQRVEALAQSSFIPAGSRVRVSAVEGSQIKVRPLA
jgi:membrane-bound ClpP family serine protease